MTGLREWLAAYDRGPQLLALVVAGVFLLATALHQAAVR